MNIDKRLEDLRDLSLKATRDKKDLDYQKLIIIVYEILSFLKDKEVNNVD